MINEATMYDVLVDYVNSHGARGCQKRAALSLGMRPCYLGDVLAGRRRIPRHVAIKLGYRQVRAWVKVGQ